MQLSSKALNTDFRLQISEDHHVMCTLVYHFYTCYVPECATRVEYYYYGMTPRTIPDY